MADDLRSSANGGAGTYDLVLEERRGYFFAGITADLLSHAQITSYQRKIANAISPTNVDRVMISRDVPSSATIAELNGIMKTAQLWNLTNIRYALVDLNSNNIDEYQFALLYAASRGVDINVFNSIRTAEHWLLA